ncbi:hypothetical protein BurJ1DRAFT_4609 [Burkholderiales bacterium JOSHI_001]|nr:hypothetical protein BurJ1DRAFT_4609 [Burkholderiales bacterium JOSHI_001]
MSEPGKPSPTRRLLKALFKIVPNPARKSLTNFHALARHYGQFTSMRKRSCVDRDGAAIPWYTYPAIEYLSNLDFSAKRVFEYGSGNSSVWWAGRCQHLIAIESDDGWYRQIKAATTALGNFDYRQAGERQAYVQQPGLDGADVVIIDGLYRADCADHVVALVNQGRLNPNLVVFDNADWYPGTMKRLYAALPGWVQVDFAGFGPINDYTWTTSLFINPGAPQRLAYQHALRSVAGGQHVQAEDR